MNNKLNLQFTFDYNYDLQVNSNVVGITSRSGTGKTKMAHDMYSAYLNKDKAFTGKEVILVKGEDELPIIASKELNANNIVVIDNIGSYHTKALDQVKRLIDTYKDTIFIQLGHNNWITKTSDELKTLKIDHTNKTVTLGEFQMKRS
jgi:hypothetical protein